MSTVRLALHKGLYLHQTDKLSIMVEVKESTYKEILSTQLHFILGIWSALKVFTVFFILSFSTFIVDLTFVNLKV